MFRLLLLGLLVDRRERRRFRKGELFQFCGVVSRALGGGWVALLTFGDMLRQLCELRCLRVKFLYEFGCCRIVLISRQAGHRVTEVVRRRVGVVRILVVECWAYGKKVPSCCAGLRAYLGAGFLSRAARRQFEVPLSAPERLLQLRRDPHHSPSCYSLLLPCVFSFSFTPNDCSTRHFSTRQSPCIRSTYSISISSTGG